jgi:hypothetical protein
MDAKEYIEMRISEILTEKWTAKYKKSINCSHPKGFSQRAHCAGKKKHNESHEVMEMTCPDCGRCQTHGNLNEIAKGQKDANGFTRCWPGKHAEGTKRGKNGGQVRNCVPNESVIEEEKTMSRAAKGVMKYGKDGMKELAKAGRDGASEEELDSIRDKHDNYNGDLNEEFDLVESIIEGLADHNGVDAEVIWEDLESLTDDELYVFAVTQQTITEDWQKVNKKDHTSGMSQKAVNAYRREHPGSKLKTAVTTKPSKLKRGSKASKRRKSYCSRSRGQMKMHNISCSKTPDKAICKARRRWNC